jgi:uncharacterized membrane protein
MSLRARSLLAAAVLGLAALFVPPAPNARADEPVEEVEDVDVVATPAASGPAEDEGVLGLYGKLHPAMVHLPIAWVFLVVLLDLLTFGLGRADHARFGLFTLGAAVLSVVPALTSGLVRGEVLEAQANLLPLVEAHEAVMFVMAPVLGLAFVLRLVLRDKLVGANRVAYLLLLGTAALLIGYGGHLGGRIVFGPDHLPF